MKANDRIKMLRIERGLTQDELAKRMGYADRFQPFSTLPKNCRKQRKTAELRCFA